MPRNKFPRRSLVKLLMCDDPACQCASKYTVGENGVVVSALGKHIVVKCSEPYQGLMARVIHVRKESAARHLERIDGRTKEATDVARTP